VFPAEIECTELANQWIVHSFTSSCCSPCFFQGLHLCLTRLLLNLLHTYIAHAHACKHSTCSSNSEPGAVDDDLNAALDDGSNDDGDISGAHELKERTEFVISGRQQPGSVLRDRAKRDKVMIAHARSWFA